MQLNKGKIMEIGNRIKLYEMKSEYYLSKDEAVIIRIDGHHFSKFTSGFKNRLMIFLERQ